MNNPTNSLSAIADGKRLLKDYKQFSVSWVEFL